MPRTVRPELLDALSPQDPDALHNRRDLRLTNQLMGNFRWFHRTLPPLLSPRDRVLELGAGSGELLRSLARNAIAADGLDLWPRPDDLPASTHWHQADLRTFPRYADYTAVIGNLILHQFTDDELRQLGDFCRAHARLIVACEPVRRRRFQLAYRAIGPLLGVNHVSQHDAHVSIAAGFRGDELPRLLGLDPQHWNLRVTTTWRGAYRMVAARRT